MTVAMTTTPVVELDAINKAFGSVVALTDVSATVNSGEVTCILGDNGAGKSTLIKILSGVITPDTGEYRLGGQPVAFASPREALEQGIATVYQDLAMVPLMSLWRNFFLGREVKKGVGPFKLFDSKLAKAETQAALVDMGIKIRDVDQPVGTLSGGERQSVAIARAIYFGAKILILDEPTSALGVRQASHVLQHIDRARERGTAVIFITHNPNHASLIGDHFVVLRRGRVLANARKEELGRDDLTMLMAGGDDLSELEHALRRQNEA